MHTENRLLGFYADRCGPQTYADQEFSFIFHLKIKLGFYVDPLPSIWQRKWFHERIRKHIFFIFSILWELFSNFVCIECFIVKVISCKNDFEGFFTHSVKIWAIYVYDFSKKIQEIDKFLQSFMKKNWKKYFNPKKKCDFQVALKTVTIQKGIIFKQFWVIFDEIRAKKIFLPKVVASRPFAKLAGYCLLSSLYRCKRALLNKTQILLNK